MSHFGGWWKGRLFQYGHLVSRCSSFPQLQIPRISIHIYSLCYYLCIIDQSLTCRFSRVQANTKWSTEGHSW